jgi:hypothetical protein
MNRRVASKTFGGSRTSTIGTPGSSTQVWSGGCGKAREIISLWTRKLCFQSGSVPARRIMSPSSVAKRVENMDGDGGGQVIMLRGSFHLKSWERKALPPRTTET